MNAIAASGPRSSHSWLTRSRRPSRSEQDDEERDDEHGALESGQRAQRQEDPGQRPAVPLGREERPDHEQEEQALRVGHREDRAEREHRQQRRTEDRPLPAHHPLAQSDEEDERGHERQVRHEDGHHAAERRPGPGEEADEVRVEGQEGVVVVAVDDRGDVVAVPGDPQVPPAVPAGEAPDDRRRIAGHQLRIAVEAVLGEERRREHHQARGDDGRDEPPDGGHQSR